MLIVRYRSEGALGTKGIRRRWGVTLSFPCKWSELLCAFPGELRGGGGAKRNLSQDKVSFFIALEI